jgi:anti-anti-sigma regulatory factor
VDQTNDAPVAARETIRVEQGDKQVLLLMEGQMDLDAAATLQAAAERLLAGSEGVAIDWHAAGHVCAGAVQVLLALEVALSSCGRALHVANDNPDVRRYLELAGLSSRFPLVEHSA